MLRLLAKLYGAIVSLRNYLYDRGVFEVHDLGAFTVSVGNLTTGGTGKTPLVAHIAAILADHGEKVCILTRGYGRQDPRDRVLVSDGEHVLADAATGGDEPVELAQKLLGKAIVIADADRVAAAEWARRRFGITAFVLDDGFQHRKAKRDLDIVCVDATVGASAQTMLPAGHLREPLDGLRRAAAVVITRAELASDTSELKASLADLAPHALVVECRTRQGELRSMSVDNERSANDRIYAFCGLGNPENFFEGLRRSGCEVAGKRSFRDHHRYTTADIESIEAAARDTGADALVTTRKDAVKFEKLTFTLPCFVSEIDLEFDSESLVQLLDRSLSERRLG
jgi:tetraacyldisaccharide 4'-kinase